MYPDNPRLEQVAMELLDETTVPTVTYGDAEQVLKAEGCIPMHVRGAFRTWGHVLVEVPITLHDRVDKPMYSKNVKHLKKFLATLRAAGGTDEKHN